MGTVATITTGTDLMSKMVTSTNALINAQNTIGQYSSTVSSAIGTTPAAISFDSNDTQAGFFTHSTSTNPTRLTVSATGIYRFTAQFQVSHLTTGTGQCIAYYRKNGTTEIVNSAARISANGVTNTDVLVLDVLVTLTASDYIELMAVATAASEWQVTGTVASGTSPNVIPVTPAVILTAIAFPS
jgi:hypothetical protein